MSLQLQAVTVAGAVLATDTLAGVDYQVVKLALGAAGAVDVHVDSGQQLMANSVPVVLASNQTAITIQDGGGTITVDGSVDTELPSQAVLADNTANPTTTSVGAFPHWFDGVTWDRAPGTSADGLLVNLGANNDVTVTSGSISISGTVAVTQSTSPWVVSGTVAVSAVGGTVTCDTELPAAAALTDNFANPTAPAVGSFLMLWDGATWDRWPGTSALGATVNVSFLGGQAVTLAAGAVGAGTQRVTLASDDPAVASLGVIDDWDESDRAKVNPIVGQAGVQGNSGAVSANTQRVVLATDVALPTGANTIGSIASITTSVTPGTAAGNLGKLEDALAVTGDTGVFVLAVANEANSTRAGDGDYIAIATDTEGSVRVVGNRDHDAVDAGEPLKIGVKVTDYEPDASAEPSGNKGEVAAADRSDVAANRFGELIEGVNPQRISLSTLNTTYDDSPTTVTSADVECWNYRWATFGLTIDSANTPTDLQIDIEVSLDGTNFYKLMNGPLGLWKYDDVATATAISRCLSFPICAYKIRVTITCTGTTASNTFVVTNAYLYLRN